MEKYEYGPIDLGGPAIRLLRLHQGNGTNISCELFQAWLHSGDAGVSYEALSYTWGSIELTEKIVVNKKTLCITWNLYRVLQMLCLEDQDRILWIDAICIDQTNNKERGHQVQQMGDIYKQADQVIFWLGPGTYETDIFMRSMQLLHKETIELAWKTWTRDDNLWRYHWETVQPRVVYSSQASASLQREGLQTLLDRPWFRRFWILQEVANAKAALVGCGTKFISASLFSLARDSWMSIPKHIANPF